MALLLVASSEVVDTPAGTFNGIRVTVTTEAGDVRRTCAADVGMVATDAMLLESYTR